MRKPGSRIRKVCKNLPFSLLDFSFISADTDDICSEALSDVANVVIRVLNSHLSFVLSLLYCFTSANKLGICLLTTVISGWNNFATIYFKERRSSSYAVYKSKNCTCCLEHSNASSDLLKFLLVSVTVPIVRSNLWTNCLVLNKLSSDVFKDSFTLFLSPSKAVSCSAGFLLCALLAVQHIVRRKKTALLNDDWSKLTSAYSYRTVGYFSKQVNRRHVYNVHFKDSEEPLGCQCRPQ